MDSNLVERDFSCFLDQDCMRTGLFFLDWSALKAMSLLHSTPISAREFGAAD